MFCKNQTLDLSTQIGTVWYQAPEMLMQSTIYDATVDIWSVGMSTVNEQLNILNYVYYVALYRNFVHGIGQQDASCC